MQFPPTVKYRLVVVENNAGNRQSDGGEVAEPRAPEGVLRDEMSYDASLEASAYKEGRAGVSTATGLWLRNERTQASVTSNAT